jgi:hypothetical protein
MHYVGDALKVAKAQDAIYEAYKLVTQIWEIVFFIVFLFYKLNN